MNAVANLALERESRVGTIAFIDLKAQQKRIRAKVEKRLIDVLDHGRYIAGPEITDLEEKLQEKTGAHKVIACASGTDALIIPMMGLNLTPQDAVFIPAFTYNATANAVLIAGATPVFVDVDPVTFNICPEDLQAKINAVKAEGKLKPAVICAVDLFGLPADYPAIKKIADAESITVFADAAQSFGGKQANRWVGDLAPVSGTSFFPGKALGAYGDAGATFVQSEEMVEICESIRWHGTDVQRRESVRVGMNGRLDTFQAAVLLEKLEIFYDELEARKNIAAIYTKHLGDQAHVQGTYDQTDNSFGYFTVQLDHRDAVREAMGTAGVPTAIYYQQPLHLMKAFEAYAPESGLPNCEKLADRVMSLPMHPYLTEDQAHFICEVLQAAVKEAARNAG
ncbi:DegT/DnrJ/EryC1/StrS aminotransferase family protein [Parvularcula sp. IMCC14364]|uniref:DegT/DnrJ/EryC1/StrS family aminotransferase n=1 Tax=Parvularcula sp. IMCC14364 TaxID=3067902 RepID=UPI0027420C5B|nr:DegT/DnrJ/EryC1/StrS family aminotransferase [Parvularcula sp. IMCC14364]